MKKYGDREEVFAGLAEKTRGNLTKDDLMLNKKGKIVSKKRAEISSKVFGEYKQKALKELV